METIFLEDTTRLGVAWGRSVVGQRIAERDAWEAQMGRLKTTFRKKCVKKDSHLREYVSKEVI